MSGELVVAIFALVVSLVSFEWNRRAARSTLHSAEATANSARLTAEAADRHARMPVLSPYFDNLHPGMLFIRNVGNGPAINIMLADGKPILTERTSGRFRSHYSVKRIAGITTGIYGPSRRVPSAGTRGPTRTRSG